jgi:hypothetical protein
MRGRVAPHNITNGEKDQNRFSNCVFEMVAIYNKRKAIGFHKLKDSFQSGFYNRIEWREGEGRVTGGA